MKNKRKVLVIDDEAQFVKNVRTFLKMHGYDCITASTGEEGLRKIEKENPRLVLLDILMPNMDGYSMYKEMRRKNKDLSCVVITGKERLQGLFEMEDVERVLIKPIELSELKHIVDTVFDRDIETCRGVSV